jgi:hypothetical protein
MPLYCKEVAPRLFVQAEKCSLLGWMGAVASRDGWYIVVDAVWKMEEL